MVQIIAIFTSLAFAGVIFVVMGLVFFGGGGQSAADQNRSDAQARVKANPKDPDAWEQLASAYFATKDYGQATKAATRAAELDPKNFGRVATLIQVLGPNSSAQAIALVEKYSAANPNNTDALIQLGRLAQAAGRTSLARLSYQSFLRLAPDDPLAGAVKDQLKQLNGS